MNAYPMFSLLSADPFLGKVDKHSLPQQTLMELLTEGVTDRDEICGSNDNLKDILQWKDVKLNTSDEVIEIDWSWEMLQGTIELQWLPPTVKKAKLAWNNFSGSADLTSLPDGLEYLSLQENEFEGTIDLTRLPSGIQELYLYSNNFYGKTDFSQLPESLTDLNVSDTQLEGEIVVFDGCLNIRGSNVTDKRN